MAKMSDTNDLSRRGFIKATTAGTAAAMMAAAVAPNLVYAAGSDKLRVGMIGCGGRGGGAARDCLKASKGVELVALADTFKDRIDNTRKKFKDLADQYRVTDDRCYVGLDAYKKIIEADDIDIVILTTPPGFRPMHIRAAVDAGKHIFAEKPVAVDAAGVRSVIESAEIAKQKKLAFVAGTQRRYDPAYQELVKRIHDGAIGELVSGNCYWNQSGLWARKREPGWSDAEWQIRNWIYFTWLSGDHIVEQHIHQLDIMNWVFQSTPVSAYGMGGRQARVDPVYGHIYDHFAVEYEYPNGVRVTSMCRQIDGTDGRVSQHVVGTKGTSDVESSIRGANPFRLKKPSEDAISPYQLEHAALIESIRSGNPLNEAKQVAESTLTAIMGRVSAYTGKYITWEDALASNESLFPEKLELAGSLPVAPVAIPGKLKAVS